MKSISMKASSPKATPDTLSDDVLIDLALNGNQGAYSVIVQRHQRMLRAVISRYFKLEEDIEECLQDTFVRMYRALPGFRRECKLSSWLCRIAISTALNRLKSKNSRREQLGEEAIPEAYQLAGIPEALERIERQETGHWLRRAINLLSGKDAAVLNQFYLQGMSVDEICQATGLTESNIKTRLMRARNRLRDLVEQRFRQQLMN